MYLEGMDFRNISIAFTKLSRLPCTWGRVAILLLILNAVLLLNIQITLKEISYEARHRPVMDASVIINYSGNERVYLNAVLTECSKFSNDIVVAYGSHLLDGSPENETRIEESRRRFPKVKFVRYDVDTKLDVKKRRGVSKRPSAYFTNLARYTAINHLNNKGWVFVMDCDEIPSGIDVQHWLAVARLEEDTSYKMACYWYFKLPIYQATQFEDNVLLIHFKHLTSNTIFGDSERDFIIRQSRTRRKSMTMGLTGTPLFHHYSWVRGRTALAHKIKYWGHSDDEFKGIDVERLVDRVYQTGDVNDFVHGYTYHKVANQFNITV